MLKKFEITAVIIVITITIAAQAALSRYGARTSLMLSPLSPPVEPFVACTLNGLALIAVIAIVGPRHERIWLIALLFLVVTVARKLLRLLQFVLCVYAYRRDYTCVPALTRGLRFLRISLRQDVDSANSVSRQPCARCVAHQ